MCPTRKSAFLSKDNLAMMRVQKHFLVTSYVSSESSWRTDEESRFLPPETEWSLAPYDFSKIVRMLGTPEIDLFMSYVNHKCKYYVAWLPDPNSVRVGAFTINWENLFFYAFSPFSLIHRTIQKIMRDKAQGIIVVPYWPSQPWFPLFQNLKRGECVVFKPNSKLLSSPFRQEHAMSHTLTLVAVVLSAKHSH